MIHAPRMRDSITRTFRFAALLDPVQIVPSGMRWRRVIVRSPLAVAFGVASSSSGLSTAPVDANAFIFVGASPTFILPPDQPLFGAQVAGPLFVPGAILTVEISDAMPLYEVPEHVHF